jgi:hypothetical protein
VEGLRDRRDQLVFLPLAFSMIAACWKASRTSVQNEST